MGRARRVLSVSRAVPAATASCCLVAAWLALASGAQGQEAGAQPAGAQEEALPEDGPDWVPSFGVGFGIYSREVKATVEGARNNVSYIDPISGQRIPVPKAFLTLSTTKPTTVSALGNPRLCVPSGNLAGWCGPFEDAGKENLDGGATSFHAQLLGPRWRSAPLSPRPFVQGMFALPISSRTLAHDGFKPVDFPTIGREPQVRIEMEAEPKNFWQAGGGVALKLPWERYDVRAKLGLGFSQEEIDVTTKSWLAVRRSQPSICPDDPPTPPGQANPPIIAPLTQQKNSLSIQSITPSIGLEADVARFGPVQLSISADTFFSVALSGTKGAFENFDSARQGCNFDGKGTGQVAHSFEADDLQIFGTVGVHFGWVGFER
jgi:hypothetical protein